MKTIETYCGNQIQILREDRLIEGMPKARYFVRIINDMATIPVKSLVGARAICRAFEINAR